MASILKWSFFLSSHRDAAILDSVRQEKINANMCGDQVSELEILILTSCILYKTVCLYSL